MKEMACSQDLAISRLRDKGDTTTISQPNTTEC